MRYELYVDSLIITNFVMNLYLLFLVNASTLRTATPGRMAAGAIVGAVGFVLPFWGENFSAVWFGVGTLLGMVVMLCITFSVKSMKMFFKLFERLLVFSFAMGGGLLFIIKAFPGIRLYLTDAFVLLGLGGLLLGLFCRAKFDRPKSSFCEVILMKGEERIMLHALIDSGNSLVEPISGKPVCVVEKEVVMKSKIPDMTQFRVIPYHSVGKKNGVLPGYLLPKMQVQRDDMVYEFENVYIAVSEEIVQGEECIGEKSIKMIMNPSLFLEKEGAVKRQNERKNDSESGNAGKNAN